MTTTNKDEDEMLNESRQQRRESDRKLKSGFEQHFRGIKSLSLDGQEYKVSEISELLQKRIDAYDNGERARLAWLESLREADAVVRETARLRRALRSYAIAVFGEDGAALADLGIKPRKQRRRLTTEEQMVAVERLRATRARRARARHPGEEVVSELPPGAVQLALVSTPSGALAGGNGRPISSSA